MCLCVFFELMIYERLMIWLQQVCSENISINSIVKQGYVLTSILSWEYSSHWSSIICLTNSPKASPLLIWWQTWIRSLKLKIKIQTTLVIDNLKDDAAVIAHTQKELQSQSFAFLMPPKSVGHLLYTNLHPHWWKKARCRTWILLLGIHNPR